jgi:hypothetical protein
MQEDALEALVKRRAAAEQSSQRGIDGLAGAIETIIETPAQQTDARTICGFCEHRLWVEPGDKGFRADIVRHKTGRDANGPVGTVSDAQRNRHGEDQRACDEPSQNHRLLPVPDQRCCGEPLA